MTDKLIRDIVIKGQLLELSQELNDIDKLTKKQMKIKLAMIKYRIDSLLSHYEK
jgi:hypothetical protein